jgi:2-methylcitrate dehydratase PrpD
MNDIVAPGAPSQPATDPSGPTGRLAGWLERLRLDDVPEDVRTRAKHLLLDGLGCAHVGAQLPWSRTAVELVTRFEGTGAKTIIGWGRTSARFAAKISPASRSTCRMRPIITAGGSSKDR